MSADDFIRVLGWRVPARIGSVELSNERVHAAGQAWDNVPGRRERGNVRAFTFDGIVLPEQEADTLEALLEGRAHRWSFNEHAFSSSGIGPESGSVYSVVRDDDLAVFGRGYLKIESGDSVTFDVELDVDWMVAYWRALDTAAEHVIVTSGGAKFLDGVRDDTLDTSELVVDSGAIALGEGSYDDLFVFETKPPDAFCEALFEWTSFGGGQNGLDVRLPLDGDGRDVAGGIMPDAVGASTVWAEGLTHRAAHLPGTGSISYPSSAAFAAADKDFFTVSGLLHVGSLASLQVVLNTLDALSFAGWRLSITTTGQLSVAVRMAASTLGAASAAGSLEVGSWYYFAFEIDVAAQTVTLWLDDEEAATATSAEAIAYDSPKTLRVGDLDSGGSLFTGALEELRIRHRRMSAVERELERVYLRAGVADAGPRPLSDAPVLDLDGEIVGARPLRVVGETGGQRYRQVGFDEGWANNAREVPGELQELKPATSAERIPQPDAMWLLDTRLLEGDDLRDPHGRGLVATRLSADVVAGAVGPFGKGQAFDFPGSAGAALQVPQDFCDLLVGRRCATILAWVRADVADGAIISLTSTGGNTMFILRTTGSDIVEFAARSRGADGYHDVQGATTIGTGWRLLGGDVDVEDGVVRAFVDGALDGSANVTFADDRFEDELSGPESYIGAFESAGPNGEPFDGRIASVMLWTRRLSLFEHRSVYRLGERGILR